MGFVLNKRIAEGLVKEEDDTARKYHELARIYNIPELHVAADQESTHAQLFRNLIRSGRI
jgi:hypothetical protein